MTKLLYADYLRIIPPFHTIFARSNKAVALKIERYLRSRREKMAQETLLWCQKAVRFEVLGGHDH